jgi:glycosyltransferase involved in cell wall biosynthesis
MPSVSVIIPTWNRATTIVAAVESALKQTHAPLEILVCDDGSDDDSEAHVRRLSDPRVVWLPGPRGGRPAIPRNRGIAAARGDWLAFLDSDDEWVAEKLARQLDVLRLSGRRACSTNALRMIPGRGSGGRLHQDGPTALSLAKLFGDNRVVCSSALIAKSLMVQIEGFPEGEQLRAIEDHALWLRVACFTEFDYLADPLVIYRDDSANSVRAFDLDGSRQRREVIDDFLSWCRRHPGPESRRGALAARARLRRDRFMAVAGPLRSAVVRGLAVGWRRLSRPR